MMPNGEESHGLLQLSSQYGANDSSSRRVEMLRLLSNSSIFLVVDASTTMFAVNDSRAHALVLIKSDHHRS